MADKTDKGAVTKGVVELLNEMFRTDQKATTEMFAVRVGVNEKLAAHPEIVCIGGTKPRTSVLGLLNGALARQGEPLAGIVYNAREEVVGFTVLS